MFKLWQNETMTTEYGRQGANSRFQTLNFDAAGGSIDLVMYFGSPNPAHTLRTAKNSGIDNITLSVTDALADRANNTAYTVGAIVEPAGGNGYLYQCTTAGTTATPPRFLTTVGATIADGTAVWTCLGKRHAPSEIKLALSKAGLDSATAGGALSLGAELKGGAAVAIYVRITSAVNDLYNAGQTPQLAISINECAIGAA
ncbi:MAG: hypothetical protein D8B42_09245 [Kingella sp. (in: b-proteobacteria)]|nr:MAG: hypothetical protein D8B42_09245 [Kingella sp. (in: b-proteobacteria)]